MNNQAIIDEIKAKLTKNKDTDVSYLETELIVFRTLKNDEVVAALEQLLFSYLSKAEKEEYDIKTHEILSVRYDDYQKCMEYLANNKTEEAKQILIRLIKTYEKIENVKTFNYYDFEQMIEYIAFSKSVENAKKLNIKRYPEAITYYCYQLAIIYLNENNLDKAKEYLTRALKFNPSSMYVLEELINLYLLTNKFDESLSLAKYAIQIAYTKQQLANVYEALGLGYYKIENFELALCCLVASAEFSDNENTQMLIFEISQKYMLGKPSINEVKVRLEQENINYGPSKELIDAINDFIVYLKKLNDLVGLKYLLTIGYELTDDEFYKKQICIVEGKEKR